MNQGANDLATAEQALAAAGPVSEMTPMRRRHFERDLMLDAATSLLDRHGLTTTVHLAPTVTDDEVTIHLSVDGDVSKTPRLYSSGFLIGVELHGLPGHWDGDSYLDIDDPLTGDEDTPDYWAWRLERHRLHADLAVAALRKSWTQNVGKKSGLATERRSITIHTMAHGDHELFELRFRPFRHWWGGHGPTRSAAR